MYSLHVDRKIDSFTGFEKYNPVLFIVQTPLHFISIEKNVLPLSTYVDGQAHLLRFARVLPRIHSREKPKLIVNLLAGYSLEPRSSQ